MLDAGKAVAVDGVARAATEQDSIETARREAEDTRMKRLIQEQLSRITAAFGQRLEAIVHNMEAIDDGHRFRLAFLRKHRDTQMHHGYTSDEVEGKQ
eukprot:jgi/Tetstr1/428818/TSEL_018805.t1